MSTTPITRALLRQHDACYTDEQLDALGLPDGTDLLTILRRDDIPARDRIWLATRPGVVEPAVMWRWLALLVERTMGRVPNPDPRSLAVVPLLRRLGAGEDVPQEERAAARAAAWAAYDDAWAAARAAAWAAWAAAARAAYDDAWAAWAADEAADEAARAASAAAARAAAWAAYEERQQVRDLIDLLTVNSDHRCNSVTRVFRETGKGS